MKFEALIGVQIKAIICIIDRGDAMRHGVLNSNIWMEGAEKRLITCFEHLLYAGKIPGTKAVQERVKDILRELHKCTSSAMVLAVVKGQTEEHRDDRTFDDALQWLDNLVGEWSFFITAGLPGSTPSQQCIESFNRNNKRVVELHVSLAGMVNESIPQLLMHLYQTRVFRSVQTRSPVGMQFVVRALCPQCLSACPLT